MTILSTAGWSEYELIDSGDGARLERFGSFVISRPDPQIIWKPSLPQSEWEKADAVFVRTSSDKGVWKAKRAIPEKWKIIYKNLSFFAKLTPFKHTGIFPEQSIQWDWIQEKITRAKRSIHVLNLFGYTGIASLAAIEAGAKVTHVDASKPAITWARENTEASGLSDKPIRWMLDDALKFTAREERRGVRYDGIIMDPPVYGHGPKGEKWDFNKHFPLLLQNCQTILSDLPLFILVNAYALSSSALMLQNVLADYTKNLKGTIEVGELALQEKSAGRLLSTGIFGKWFR